MFFLRFSEYLGGWERRRSFWWFEGEACGFPGSDNIICFVWISFVSGDAVRLAAWAFNGGEKLTVRLERYCQLVEDDKMCVESVLDPW